jgi:hypothetical protein
VTARRRGGRWLPVGRRTGRRRRRERGRQSLVTGGAGRGPREGRRGGVRRRRPSWVGAGGGGEREDGGRGRSVCGFGLVSSLFFSVEEGFAKCFGGNVEGAGGEGRGLGWDRVSVGWDPQSIGRSAPVQCRRARPYPQLSSSIQVQCTSSKFHSAQMIRIGFKIMFYSLPDLNG